LSSDDGLEIEIPTAKILMMFFWGMMLCGLVEVQGFNHEARNRMILQNVGVYLGVHTASQSRTTLIIGGFMV
jgi:hypothetical protein